MCDDAFRQFLIAQTSQGVESPSGLESTDALVVFAFEKEVDLRSRWPLVFERGTDQGLGGLRSRRNVIEGSTCQYWRFVNVVLDKFVGRLHRGSDQGERLGDVSHCDM